LRTARAMRARCLGDVGACLARYNRVGSAAFAIVPCSRARSSDRNIRKAAAVTTIRGENNAWRETHCEFGGNVGPHLAWFAYGPVDTNEIGCSRKAGGQKIGR